ncbi:hypothetical protein CBM2637_B80007 [Cupriavidus taiwanensis]|nr:hypothetical protein CBM2637_A240003 [Cupriavidus taiwanensis]SPA34913.1 hypothetical protein CBM2637_B80007 [Cupriavidus taiwanensis]
MPYSKSSFDHFKIHLVDTITTRYRVCTAASHQRSRDTFTTSHIVKEQPIIQIAWQCQMQTLNAKRLHLANQTKVPGVSHRS